MKFAAVEIQCHGLRGVGLKLQRTGAGPGRRLHDLQSPLQRLIVIAGHLRDDQWTVSLTYQPTANVICRAALMRTASWKT